MRAMASDFDGTLYFMFEEESVRVEDLEAIHRFQKEGNLFGVCTGRSLRGITDVLKEVDFDFYIVASGAYVLDKKENVLSKVCIPYEVMKEIFERYESKVMLIIQANDTVYSLVEDRPLLVHIDSIEEMEDADIYGLSFGTESPLEARMITEEVNRLYGDCVIAYHNVRNVDIVSKECSKGKALQLVREHYGIDKMAGIGDSYNDIPMMKAADQAYTFPYAPEAAKEAAGHQIVKNVAEALEAFRSL